MDWTVRLPSVLYRLSAKKAGGDRELQAHIRQYLERWTAEPNALNVRLADAVVFCPDCQRVHTPGHCPRVT